MAVVEILVVVMGIVAVVAGMLVVVGMSTVLDGLVRSALSSPPLVGQFDERHNMLMEVLALTLPKPNPTLSMMTKSIRAVAAAVLHLVPM
jgi:hypothetical protein